MEQGRGVGDYHQPLPLVRKLRAADYHGPHLLLRKCPRCQSNDTKFCYFNNYNVDQPRYYCRTCKPHWTHGGIQRDIPSGGKSHTGKRSTSKRENHRVQLHLPSPPQLPPFYPPTNVAPLAFIPSAVPSMMTPYRAGGGFLTPIVAEATTQPQQFHAENGYLSLANPLKSMEPLYNSNQSFLQPAARHSGSRTQKFLSNNNDGASSSNVISLNTSMGSNTTSGGTDVGWGSLIMNPNEWLDFSGGFGSLA